ncbi:hypothetical protein Tco_0914354 [Tanacetum coccineum]
MARLWWPTRHPQPATTVAATGKRCHDGCYGGSVVVRRRVLQLVIWWQAARWRWCEGGDEGDGCDGSMVEGVALGGGDGSEAAAHSPKKFSGGRKTPWRRRIFEGGGGRVFKVVCVF